MSTNNTEEIVNFSRPKCNAKQKIPICKTWYPDMIIRKKGFMNKACKK